MVTVGIDQHKRMSQIAVALRPRLHHKPSGKAVLLGDDLTMKSRRAARARMPTRRADGAGTGSTAALRRAARGRPGHLVNALSEDIEPGRRPGHSTRGRRRLDVMPVRKGGGLATEARRAGRRREGQIPVCVLYLPRLRG
jgi:hypothetical protein